MKSTDKRVQESQIREWIFEDEMRMEALTLASRLGLNDWCIGAGFVRNLVWDRCHQRPMTTPLSDIDLIYFDSNCLDEPVDRAHEQRLRAWSDLPWSVKNQARMHQRNHDQPYQSTQDAMSYWVEVETAVGVRLTGGDRLEIIAPFGVARLFENTITLNRKRPKLEDFFARVEAKQWQTKWPALKIDIKNSG